MTPSHGPLRVGIGGPVGAGKTTLTEKLCAALAPRLSMAVVTNDIYTREDADYLVRAQVLPAQRSNALLARIAWPAAVALAAQGLWSIYTQLANLTVVSVLIILLSLGALLVVMRALVEETSLSRAERLLVAPAFSALTAWLTAASIVNVAASLRYHGLGGSEPTPFLAAAMVVIGALIAALAAIRLRGAPLYGLVFAYALVAINASGGQRFAEVGWAALGGAALVLAATLWRLWHPDGRRLWLGVQGRPTLT